MYRLWLTQRLWRNFLWRSSDEVFFGGPEIRVRNTWIAPYHTFRMWLLGLKATVCILLGREGDFFWQVEVVSADLAYIDGGKTFDGEYEGGWFDVVRIPLGWKNWKYEIHSDGWP